MLISRIGKNCSIFVGATLEIVTDQSQEGTQFVNGFGGIGALLRYRVDFQTHEMVNETHDFDLNDY